MAELEAGVPPDNVRFSFELRGSDGWLSLTSNHPYGFQAGDLKLTSSITFDEPVPAAVPDSFMAASINVRKVYAQLVRDLHAGTYNTPGFEHALHNAQLIEAVRRAAERGARQKFRSKDLERPARLTNRFSNRTLPEKASLLARRN